MPTPHPKLTVGMATYDDFDGVYFSVMALRLYHQVDEILVIDNAPASASSPSLQYFCETVGARYVALPEPVGTSAPRDRVFSEAQGELVVCLDSHVLVHPDGLRRLAEWFAAHPDSQNLVSGPLYFDPLGEHYATHFDAIWRDEMWGVWGQAWRCACAATRFSNLQDGSLTHARFLDLLTSLPVTGCDRCGLHLPTDIDFAESVSRLQSLGCHRLGGSTDDPVYEVAGHGLGLFACRKSAWPGFHPQFRGFGGEELYIHQKFRNAGRKNLILPFLRWSHRFGRPRGTPYPHSHYDKVRNYVLGHRELGLDLAPIEKHFVTELKKVPPHEWEMLVADPESATREVVAAKVNAQGKSYGQMDAEELLFLLTSTPRDLDQHLEALATLAANCRHVTEFSGRRESAIALLAGVTRPVRQGRSTYSPSVVSFNTETDPLLLDAAHRFAPVLRVQGDDSPAVASIEDTDLLFLDTRHNAQRLRHELSKFAKSVRHYLVIHDTQIFGTNGDDGGPGLLTAIAEFLESSPEWFVASHDPKQYGLTVLSRDAADRPAEPIKLMPIGAGPGTELKALLKQLGIAENPNCDCNKKAAQMDEWGVLGCREHFAEIVGWMREGQGKWGWKDKLTAAAKALASGIAFQVNWSDPFPGLIELAIERAAEKEQLQEKLDR